MGKWPALGPEMLCVQPVALLYAREKMPFELVPFYLHLEGAGLTTDPSTAIAAWLKPTGRREFIMKSKRGSWDGEGLRSPGGTHEHAKRTQL